MRCWWPWANGDGQDEARRGDRAEERRGWSVDTRGHRVERRAGRGEEGGWGKGRKRGKGRGEGMGGGEGGKRGEMRGADEREGREGIREKGGGREEGGRRHGTWGMERRAGGNKR